MNPFSANHLIIAACTIVALLLMRREKNRGALLTFLAVFGALAANSFNPLVYLMYLSITFMTLWIGWKFGNRISNSGPPSARGSLIWGLVLLFFPLLIFKLIIALVPSVLEKAIQTKIPGFSMGIIIPLGMSYFCFRAAAYMFEIYHNQLDPVGFWKYIQYTLFWPTLTAGPIERPRQFFEQTKAPKAPTGNDLVEGFARVMIGFFKKAVLAEIFVNLARPYLNLNPLSFSAELSQIQTPHLWLCVTSYYLFLYCDFSGYSDIAIGVSRMMGIRIMENFRWPILASNVADFWRRWHISLTSWVTDYIYIALGGNRKGLKKAGQYTLIAMLVVGAWHGLSLHFLLWGAYHGAFLILYRNWRKKWRKSFMSDEGQGAGIFTRFLSWFLTFTVINLGWVLFLYPADQALLVWLRLFGLR